MEILDVILSGRRSRARVTGRVIRPYYGGGRDLDDRDL